MSKSHNPTATRILFSAADALQPPPAHTWAVHGLFHRPGLFMLIGDPGSKKSFTAVDLAVCVAAGKPWLTRATQPGPVLFVDEQAGPHQLLARLHASMLAHAVPAGLPLQLTSLAGFNLRNHQSADALIDRSLDFNAQFIVIDNFVSLLRGGNEASQAAVLPVLFHLRRLAEACNAAVLVIHHTNKHGLFRGSAAIAAAVDLMLHVDSPSGDTSLAFTCLKSRAQSPPDFYARAVFQTGAPQPRIFLERLEEAPSAQPEAASQSQAAGTAGGTDNRRKYKIPLGLADLSYTLWYDLTKFDFGSFEDFCWRHKGYAPGSIRNAIQDLLKTGLIVRSNEGSKGKKAVYKLAEPPLEELTQTSGE